jgi:hypothetical protein
MTDKYEEHSKAPLAQHLDAYRSSLEAKNDNPRHVSQTITQ